ncbi:SGNH/GDSL hydrolase family protein [Microbacterium sp. P5_E9]
MHLYPADHPALDIRGALFLEPVEGGGLRPHRLPETSLTWIHSAGMRLMVDTAAGVRVHFTTRASRIEILAAVHPVDYQDLVVLSASVDLVVNGELRRSEQVIGGAATFDHVNDRVEVNTGPPVVVVFDGLGSDDKSVELWLPHSAVTELFEISADQPIRPADASDRPRWVVYGSSITNCMEVTRPTSTWPAIAARTLGYDLIDLGFSGNAVLDPFVARAIRDTKAELITLKVGINIVGGELMRERVFIPAMHGFLDTIRDGHPETPIQVISPIACAQFESTPGPRGVDTASDEASSLAPEPYPAGSLTLARIRSILREIVEIRAARGERVAYLDGRDLFSDADIRDGHLRDGIHPDETGYRLIGERYAQLPAHALARA